MITTPKLSGKAWAGHHLLCRRHHLLKTAGKIQPHRDHHGRLYWTTRHNRHHPGSPPTEHTKLALIHPPDIPPWRELHPDNRDDRELADHDTDERDEDVG